MVVIIGKLDGDIGVFNYEGSSPRMRGTHDVIAFHALRPGIIPAYARNTCRNDTRGCCTWDHPRVCGEHGTTLGSKRLKRGSSPRMRGTPEKDMEPYQTGGIIPAYAGNTKDYREHTPHVRDHPRVCGEHCKGVLICGILLGSSPRMRGTPSQTQCAARPSGIIPAYAGNTVTIMKNPSKTWDHPRVCGEHLTGNPYLLMVQGSSPRMRGTLGFSVTNTNDAGIIPAYAGNTWRPSSNLRCVRDHPRVCGEHEAFGTSASKAQGSSPRMRGTLVARIPEEIRGWIIPAYAGNTK